MTSLDKYKYHILMAMALLVSFVTLSSNRENHYQEVDSVLSYDLLQNPDNQILTYALSSYSPSPWSNYKKEQNNKDINYYLNLTPNFILERLIDSDFFINNFEKISKSAFDFPSSADEMRIIIINYFEQNNLENIPIHGLYRIGQSIIVSKLPPDIASVFEFPLASTYSFGMGIYYKTIDTVSKSYDSFIKNATFMNLLLLHCASMTTYLTLINIGIRPFSAIVSSLALIFTASFYTYAFHLGSTVHTFFAYSIYFFICTQFNLNKENEISKLGKINAVLLFYSYLLIIPLIAIYILTFLNSYIDSKKTFFRSISSSWTIHRTSIILTTLCVLIFYQPGQGVRGLAKDYSEFLDYFYLSILNLTGWFSSDLDYINFFQFFVFFVLLLLGAILFFNKTLKIQSKSTITLIKYSFIIYLFFMLFGLLNFSPSRHILFLQIFIIIFYSYAFMKVLEPLIKRFSHKAIFIFFVVVVGTVSQDLRLKQTRGIDFDFTSLDPSKIVITDVPNTISKKTNLQVKAIWEELEGKEDFYFISQISSIDEMSKSFGKKTIFSNKNIITILEIDDKHSFMPFTSSKFNDGRFIYNRGNGMFVYEVKNRTSLD